MSQISKISRGWYHRFQRFQWCPNFQVRCHIFHRCQIDYVTDFKIQGCLKDCLKDVILLMSQNSQRCHRWQRDNITKMSNSKIVYIYAAVQKRVMKSWPAPFMSLERGIELFTLWMVFRNFISGNPYERVSRLCDQLKVSRKIFKDERNTSGSSAPFP